MPSAFLAIARAGGTAVALHPLRSGVTVACLVVALLPFLAGLGLSHGLRHQAEAAILGGPDLVVTGDQFGHPAPLPLAALDPLRRLPGVLSVTPRIVGRLQLGVDRLDAVLVGTPPDAVPVDRVDGRFFADDRRNELVVGSDLARRLHLTVGSVLPPFYKNRRGELVSEVVGVLPPDVALEQGRVILASLATAQRVFDQPDQVTEFLITCREGYADDVRLAVLRAPVWGDGPTRPRVLTREERLAELPADLVRREGVFTLHLVLAFVVAILVLLVTSGIGLAERRREVGLLKALGWQTDEILLRAVVENAILGLAGAGLAIALAYAWLVCLNGVGIAGVFLPDVGVVPGFRVPYRLLPVPAALTVLLALVLVLTGSLWGTWRAAVAPPRDVMR